MSNSVNTNQLPTGVEGEIIEGLQGEEQPVIDVIGTLEPVMAQSGSISIRSSFGSLPNDRAEPYPEGFVLQPKEDDFEELAYFCKRYSGTYAINDGTRLTLDNAHGFDILGKYSRDCKKQSVGIANRKLAAAITSNTTSEEVSASNPWDGASGTPISDMHTGVNKIGLRPDFAVVGNDVLQALQTNDEFLSHLTNWDGGGAIAPGEVVSTLKSLFPSLQTVVLASGIYNASDPGQASISLSYAFDGVFCMGYKEDLLKIQLKGGESFAMWRDEGGEKTNLRYTDRFDQKPAHKEGRFFVSSIIT